MRLYELIFVSQSPACRPSSTFCPLLLDRKNVQWVSKNDFIEIFHVVATSFLGFKASVSTSTLFLYTKSRSISIVDFRCQKCRVSSSFPTRLTKSSHIYPFLSNIEVVGGFCASDFLKHPLNLKRNANKFDNTFIVTINILIRLCHTCTPSLYSV